MNLELIYKTLGGIIGQRRRRLELSQAKLARILGISRATLANIETGRKRVLVDHLRVTRINREISAAKHMAAKAVE
jgi:DNA-binding XRE family transcriptional regulator